MPDLAAAQVTILRTWKQRDTLFRWKTCLLVRATINTMGGNTNLIPATAFGLSEIEEVSNMVNDDNSRIVPTAVAWDRTRIVATLANATAGANSHLAPADLANDVYQFVVKGS